MASQVSRPRSSTSVSLNGRRPKSRASTASINSSSTQLQPYPHTAESIHGLRAYHAHSQPLSYTPEEMISRSEQQLSNPLHEYAVDPLLREHDNGGRALSADYELNTGRPLTRPSLVQYHSVDGKENHAVDVVNEEQLQDDSELVDGKKKKGSASSISNDYELRRLFRENQGRSLHDVAGQVLANERGPRSEKTKQIFAMLWLDSVCKRSTSSVTRSRVFSRYATRCGTERVPPLNAASFGKLVRIIFPGIQTRRLGVRGESKYHYVDLSLVENQQDTPDRGARGGLEINPGLRRPNVRRQISQNPPDTVVSPSPDIPLSATSDFYSFKLNKGMASGRLYLDHSVSHIHHGSSQSNMVQRELKFPTTEEVSYQEDDLINLPSIHGYLPIGTDIDASNALTALYRSHCISVIDSFRFCKEKMLWHHFTSFHGTLTVPVQKLLAHSNVAPWIKECDWLMYQKMVKFVAPLALQVMPVKVIETFRAISSKLGSHISLTFQNLPQHVRDAKLGPAVIFASLLDRLLRVNATAHAAANMLTNDANRDQMWQDWVMSVKPIKVVESTLPLCGYTRVLQILTGEIRDLLGPLRTTTHIGMNPIFAEADISPNASVTHPGFPEMDNSSPEGVLDRWINFLHTLPSRFPGADARLLLHCVGEVGSAALRDITMAQSLSFGSWWVTKVWVDEMLQWLAEKGGFLEQSPQSMEIRGKPEFSPDLDFPIDEASETIGCSRPRTAASESVDAPSRLQSIDAGGTAFRGHSRPASGALERHESYPDSLHDTNSHDERGQTQSSIQPLSHSLTDNIDYGHTYPLDISHQHIQHEELRHTNGQPGGTNSTLAPADSSAQLVQTVGQGNDPDDSGIGIGLDEDDDLNIAKYSRFVTSGVNGGSDPTNVVVC